MSSSEKDLILSEILIQVDNMQCIESIPWESPLLLSGGNNACYSIVDKKKSQGILGLLNLIRSANQPKILTYVRDRAYECVFSQCHIGP